MTSPTKSSVLTLFRVGPWCYGGFVNALELNEGLMMKPTAGRAAGQSTNAYVSGVVGRSGCVLSANEQRICVVLRGIMPTTPLATRRGPAWSCSRGSWRSRVRVPPSGHCLDVAQSGRASAMIRLCIPMPATTLSSDRPEASGGPVAAVYLSCTETGRKVDLSGRRNMPARPFRKTYRRGGPMREPVIPGSNPGGVAYPRCIENAGRSRSGFVVNAPGSPLPCLPRR